MPRRGTNSFTRSNLKRAIRGACEMGLSVDSVEIGKDGRIVLHTRKRGDAESGLGTKPDRDTPEKILKNL
jgi:hypothetical protein